jgi:hypothetical protein
VKELEDQSWFPPTFRKYQTEYIGFFVSTFNVYQAFERHIEHSKLAIQPMVDLCSGSGEPAISIFRKSNRFSQLLLSDKYPNALRMKDNKITYNPLSQDVLKTTFQNGTCYTMFNSFHHFTDEEKIKIVEKIRKTNSSSYIVEILEPNPICFLKVLIATTIGSLLLTPFIPPFSLKRLLLTYILPINLVTITFDGLVSVFKSRSKHHYSQLFAGFNDSVKVLRIKNGLAPIVLITIESNA